MKLPRIMQIGLTTMFTLMGLMGLVAAVRTGGEAGLPIVILGFLMATIIFGIFQVQLGGAARRGKQVRAILDAIAPVAFDPPGALREGYDMTVTAGAFAGSLLNAVDAGPGFTISGSWRGVPISVASHVSIAGRQLFELFHVYSYVLVDLGSKVVPFKLVYQNTFSKVVAGTTKDAQLGDAAFDDAWIVDTDDALARAVYVDTVRRRLLDLQARAGLVSMNVGVQTGVSIVLTSKGLALRWPGDLDTATALGVRDLLLEMRERMLAHFEGRAPVLSP